MASALMKDTLSGRIEAGNIARAHFRSLPPCRRHARTAFFPIPRFFAKMVVQNNMQITVIIDHMPQAVTPYYDLPAPRRTL